MSSCVEERTFISAKVGTVGEETTVHGSGDDDGSAIPVLALDLVLDLVLGLRGGDEDEFGIERSEGLLPCVREGDCTVLAEWTRLLRTSSLRHERKML